MLCHTGTREVPAPCARASVSQTWHETGQGSYKHQQQPNAVGNTPSAACSPLPGPRQQPAPPGSRVSPHHPRSLAAVPSLAPCQGRQCQPCWAVPASSQTLGARAGAGVGWSIRASPWCSQLTDSSPGLLLDSPPGQAPCASLSWGVTWMSSRFPGAGIGWIKQAPRTRTSPSCWQGWEQRMGHPDADANSSWAPSSARGEGKTAARAAQGQSSSRPEAPVLCQSPSRRLLLLPCWKTPSPQLHLPKTSLPTFRLKRQKMRVPGVCSMLSFTGDTTHTAQWHHRLLGIPRGIFGTVRSWQSEV